MAQTDPRVFELVKRHTKTLIQELGIETACDVTGKSRATLRRFYSLSDGSRGQVLPLADIFALEKAATFPHVTSALAQVAGGTLDLRPEGHREAANVNSDIIQLTERFGSLMSVYYRSIEDDEITHDEAERLLEDTTKLQTILVDLKRGLERELS